MFHFLTDKDYFIAVVSQNIKSHSMSVDPDSKSKASTGNAEKYLIFLILQRILSHKHRIKMLLT